VIAVIIYHGVSPHSVAYGLATYGERGVDIFFGISGFLICSKLVQEKALRGSISLSAFYSRRFLRILPPAFAYLTAIVLLGMIGLIPRVQKKEWLSCVFFFRNYTEMRNAVGLCTGHYWSLAVEEHFYLLLPGALFLLGTRRARGFVPLMAVLVAIWRYLDSRYGWFDLILEVGKPLGRTDRSIDGLLWGASLALALTHKPLLEWVRYNFTMRVWTVLLACYALVEIARPPLTHMVEGMLYPPLLYGTALHPGSSVGRALEFPPIRWVGRISYSVYLWQRLFFAAGTIQPAPWQTFPLNVLETLACACLSYYVIERPMIAIGHRLSRSPALEPPAELRTC
jgi:peptidoglycan/LPS O-acetylase OafA/YrhL